MSDISIDIVFVTGGLVRLNLKGFTLPHSSKELAAVSEVLDDTEDAQNPQYDNMPDNLRQFVSTIVQLDKIAAVIIPDEQTVFVLVEDGLADDEDFNDDLMRVLKKAVGHVVNLVKFTFDGIPEDES
jgi:hypothetical protein